MTPLDGGGRGGGGDGRNALHSVTDSADPNPAVLRLEGLSKRYRADRPPVLDGLSLELRAGEYLAIMGESGVGKSTLLNLLAGLDRADAGRVLLEGTDLASLDDDATTLLRRRAVGFVFQAFHVLPYLTVAENVALPLELLGVAAAERDRRTAGMLDAVGIELHERPPVRARRSSLLSWPSATMRAVAW